MSEPLPPAPEFKGDENFEKGVTDIFQKSQDDFEKQLSFISAGALGISMLFIDKVVDDMEFALAKGFLVVGWSALAATLFINLLSHLLSINYCYKTLQDYRKRLIKYRENAHKRSERLVLINKFTLVLLVVGITSIVIFSAINI